MINEQIIHVTTSGVNPRLRSTTENFIDMSQHIDLIDDSYWRGVTQQEFNHVLVNPESKGDFQTWKQYNNYLHYMFEGYANVHNVNETAIYQEIYGDINDLELGIEGSENEKCLQYQEIFGDIDFRQYVSDLPLSRKQTFKRGDFFVNESQVGYRMSGCFFIDEETSGQPVLIDMKCDNMDDYGTVPEHFEIISEFPLTYWHDNADLGGSWHNGYVFYDLSQLGLKFEEKDVLKYEEMIYVIFTHQNINYCFFVDTRNMTQQQFIDKLNTPYCLNLEDGPEAEFAQYVEKTYKVDKRNLGSIATY